MVGTALLGGSAASQGVLDALERGANDSQALSMGILNGIFEMLFEEVSLDKLLKGNTGSIAGKILQQGFIEGTEEFCTTAANTVADILVMADKSDYKTKVAKYRDQGLGDKEATIKALEDIAIGMGWDFVGGLLSGGIMGGGTMAAQTYLQGAGLQNVGVTAEELSQLGGTFSQDSKTGKMAGKVGNHSGAFNMGRLALCNCLVVCDIGRNARTLCSGFFPIGIRKSPIAFFRRNGIIREALIKSARAVSRRFWLRRKLKKMWEYCMYFPFRGPHKGKRPLWGEEKSKHSRSFPLAGNGALCLVLRRPARLGQKIR